MYSVARIVGRQSQLAELLKVLEEGWPKLNSTIDRRDDLVCDLSTTQNAGHWAEVAEALENIGEAVRTAAVGDIGIRVDTRFDLKYLPAGGVAIDTMAVSHIAIAAMAKLGANFEATTHRPMEKE